MMETIAFEPTHKLSLQVPEILQSHSVQEFFKSFYDLNKDSAAFTYRRFSEYIDWPHSYLSDLMSGRKPLTLSRALEFSSYFKLSTLDTERLIVMAYKDSENPRVQAHFQEQFESLYSAMKISPQTMGPVDVGASAPIVVTGELTASLMIVGSVISWFRRPMKIMALVQVCTYFDEFFPDGQLEKDLQFLEQHRSIRREGDLIIFVKDLYFVNAAKSLMGSAQIMNSILARSEDANPDPEHRMPYRNGLVEFPLTHVAELQQRVCNLANWISKVSAAACKSENYNPLENPLLKYDLFCGNFIRTKDLTNVFR